MDIGALIIKIGLWAPLCPGCNKEPPKLVLVTIQAPILQLQGSNPTEFKVSAWDSKKRGVAMRWPASRVSYGCCVLSYCAGMTTDLSVPC